MSKYTVESKTTAALLGYTQLVVFGANGFQVVAANEPLLHILKRMETTSTKNGIVNATARTDVMPKQSPEHEHHGKQKSDERSVFENRPPL